MPSTFKDAVIVSRRLGLRYLWIDSLCIIQDDLDDWLRESVKMLNVYRNSYCNISATAASDSERGLYFGRDPQCLWEDEINLNTEGIPGLQQKQTHYLGNEPLIRRCSIQDLSFWDRIVEDAPVNRRAWVLQERLLSPRVLHFCQDQLAWECRQCDAAECLPLGISHFELEGSEVREGARLKALIPEEYGPQPIGIDLMQISRATHEDWKRIVEKYSTASLTKPQDKLIAIAGIAELLSTRIGKGFTYAAGIWEMYLASQLLWHVNDVYEDGQLSYPSRRRSEYGLPTFS